MEVYYLLKKTCAVFLKKAHRLFSRGNNTTRDMKIIE